MPSQQENFVSVIIPTCNRADRLQKAIDSVLNQTRRAAELIVVDDGSTDNTRDLVTAYGDKVVSIRQENRGPAAARNAGINAARSELIAFLDSDDWFAPQKLAIQVAAMSAAPDYLVSHTDERWYRNGQLLNQKKKHRKGAGDIFERSLGMCVVGMSTVMARRCFFDQVGMFDEQLPCCEDYDLWLRASIMLPFLYVDEPLTMKDGGRPDQLSAIYGTGIDRFRITSLLKLLKSDLCSRPQELAAMAELERKCRIYGNGCCKHGRNEEGEYYLGLPDAIRAMRKE